jgi:hypothetical protein
VVAPEVTRVLSLLLLVLGVGFLIANLRLVSDFIRFFRLRSQALLTWPGAKPPHYGLLLGIGVALGVLLFVKLVLQRRAPHEVFGEAMMFAYYAYLLPLSLRIGRGFYEDGVWAESGFVPYHMIAGLSWREEEPLTLLLIPRMKRVARRLVVPRAYYGQARRLLRDKIAHHDIHFADRILDLGVHDDRDTV